MNGDWAVNFLDAAHHILKQSGKPLHYAEITKRALASNILDTKGQTPAATMGSRLYVDTKRPNSRFKRVGRNFFALADIEQNTISQQISVINEDTRNRLRKRLMEMPPDRFEALIGELLIALGFEEDKLQVTAYSGDGGIDVRGILNAGNITEVNAAVQVKRWKGNIQAPIVQALRGSLVVHEQGIIITTSKFSKGAIQEAQAPGKARISLVDGEQLLELLMTHKIGVKSEAHTVYSLDEDWWSGIAATTDGNGTEEISPVSIQDTDEIDPHIGYPVRIQATAHGQVFWAELLDAGGRVRYNGTEYSSPSSAGKAATAWKACNGWSLWRYQQPTTEEWRLIQELRA